jgi:hypothetical protein
MEATSITILEGDRKRILAGTAGTVEPGLLTDKAEADEAVIDVSDQPKLKPAGRFVYCDEIRHLLELFGEAAQELLHLHKEQLLAIIEGDPDSHRFERLIHLANEKKQEAKYAYLRHMEMHGCSSAI